MLLLPHQKKTQKKNLNKILASPRKLLTVGFTNATSAGGTYKRDAILKVNGYDERILRGEETELGERFRAAGYNIWLLDAQLGVHSPKFVSIFGLFKRRFIDGKATMYNSLIGRMNNYFISLKKSIKKDLYLNFALIFILIISVVFKNFLFLIIFILLRIIYLFINIRFRKKIKNTKIFLYSLLMLLTSPTYFLGQITTLLKYLFSLAKKKNEFYSEKQIF